MGAAPVRVDRPTERHGRTGRDGVQGASGGHLVKADAGHVLGRDGTEDATHPSEAGQRVTVVGVDRLLLPAHDVDSNTCTYADQPATPIHPASRVPGCLPAQLRMMVGST